MVKSGGELYSMKIKEQTRKLAVGCSKHSFEVVDKTDEVSEHIYGKAKLTWFEFDFRRVLYLHYTPSQPPNQKTSPFI